MQGTRLPDGEYIEISGGYSKHRIQKPDRTIIVCWMMKAPSGGSNFLIGHPNSDGSPYHWVRENEDGTITVEPNPPDAPEDRRNSNSILSPNGWHGYIYNGEWRELNG